MNLPSIENCTIAILGLGYVGLPLAIAFDKTKYCEKNDIKLSRKIIGFDINKQRIRELNQNVTDEITPMIINNINSKQEYLREINAPPPVNDLPINDHSAGNKTLSSYSRYNICNKFFKKAIKYVPLASQTFSKSYIQWPKGAFFNYFVQCLEFF